MIDTSNQAIKSIQSDEQFFDNQVFREWLSTKEAASYLCITPNALRIYVCRGRIQAFKLGNRLRFRINDLRLLLLKKEVINEY